MQEAEAHIVRPEIPWPPYPEADFMYSRHECSCGWRGRTFRDVRGEDGPRIAREEAERHRAEARYFEGSEAEAEGSESDE